MYTQSLAGPWMVTAKNATTFTITIDGGASTTYTMTPVISQQFPPVGVHAPGFTITTSVPLSRTISFTQKGMEAVFTNTAGPELVIVCNSVSPSLALPPVAGTPISFTVDATSLVAGR